MISYRYIPRYFLIVTVTLAVSEQAQAQIGAMTSDVRVPKGQRLASVSYCLPTIKQENDNLSDTSSEGGSDNDYQQASSSPVTLRGSRKLALGEPKKTKHGRSATLTVLFPPVMRKTNEPEEAKSPTLEENSASIMVNNPPIDVVVTPIPAFVTPCSAPTSSRVDTQVDTQQLSQQKASRHERSATMTNVLPTIQQANDGLDDEDIAGDVEEEDIEQTIADLHAANESKSPRHQRAFSIPCFSSPTTPRTGISTKQVDANQQKIDKALALIQFGDNLKASGQEKEAISCFKAAAKELRIFLAEQGDVPAAYRILGSCYERGIDGESSLQKAVNCYTAAATIFCAEPARGDHDAQVWLAQYYTEQARLAKQKDQDALAERYESVAANWEWMAKATLTDDVLKKIAIQQ